MRSQPRQRNSIIKKSAFLHNFASAIQRTKPVPPLSQIQSHRDLTVLMLLLHFGVILREESYLEKKFGEEYLSLKRQVRRWL